jgi:MATE family multidrug resistance protein
MEAKTTDISCSVPNLLAISLPVICSIMSGTLMYIFDRILLAHYSVEAMNGAGVAHWGTDLFLLPLLSFAAISEVFVGQFNGARQFKKASDPIMQIAVFLILVWVIILPIALYLRKYFIPASLWQEGNPYYCIGMIMIPFQVINSSISAFFIGTRRPNIILIATLIANTINCTLDYFFIFGIGPIPPLGAKGAALGSLIAIITSAGILGASFFNSYNSQNYDSRHLSVDFKILTRNIRLGAPYALSEFFELSFWLILLLFLEKISMDAVTIQNVGCAIWVLFTFISEGFQKGVMGLASNCLGAGKDILIRRLLRSMLWITFWFAIFSAIPLLFYPEQLIEAAFKITAPRLMADIKVLLLLMWLSYIILLVSHSCMGGILSSGGDTTFVTIVKMSSVLFCLIIPVCIFYSRGELTALTGWWLGIFQITFNGIFFYGRYRDGKWKSNVIS